MIYITSRLRPIGESSHAKVVADVIHAASGEEVPLPSLSRHPDRITPPVYTEAELDINCRTYAMALYMTLCTLECDENALLLRGLFSLSASLFGIDPPREKREF